jgi:hypothetical protein
MLMALTAGLARFSTLTRDPDVHAETTKVVEQLLRGDLFTAPRRARRRTTTASKPTSGRAARSPAHR